MCSLMTRSNHGLGFKCRYALSEDEGWLDGAAKSQACRMLTSVYEVRLSLPAQEHPNVPVVTNMEDIWKVSKLQRERERKADTAAKAQARKEAVAAATTGKEGMGGHAARS